MAVNLKTYKFVQAKIYCQTHAPVNRSTALDSVVTRSALCMFPFIQQISIVFYGCSSFRELVITRMVLGRETFLLLTFFFFY
jgi:hypothetical protein